MQRATKGLTPSLWLVPVRTGALARRRHRARVDRARRRRSAGAEAPPRVRPADRGPGPGDRLYGPPGDLRRRVSARLPELLEIEHAGLLDRPGDRGPRGRIRERPVEGAWHGVRLRGAAMPGRAGGTGRPAVRH